MAARPFAWEKSYPPGLRWDMPILTGTIPALFDTAVAAFGERPAIDFRERAITYADLGREVERMAAALLRHGVGPGTPVALYLPNTPFHPIGFFAASKAGARVVHLSPLDAERELAGKLRDSGARFVLTTNAAGLAGRAGALAAAGLLDTVVVGEDARWGLSAIPAADFEPSPAMLSWSTFVDGAAPPPRWPAVAPSDPALIQYTGGTTGTPKGAILTHANLTAAVSMYEAWFGGQGVSLEREKAICALPLFHIYALTTILLRQLKAGGELLLRQRFDAETTLRDIAEKRATTFAAVPTMWIALANHPGVEARDLSSLVHCSSGGAPLPIEVAQRFARLTGLTLRGGWGMTETAPAGTNIPRGGPAKPGTVGIPLPGVELEIVALDDPSRVLPAGEAGEFRVRGPNVTPGYWNRPEETAAAFADGGLLSGDIGYMDEDGYFFLVDRKKDMIISGGFNIYPQAIEGAIYEHADVEEVLVVGVPDAYRGESAKAFVKLRPGAAGFTLSELQAFLADKLGPHEMPRALEFRPALPRTPVGKLSKRELREEALAAAGAALRQTA